MKPLTIVAIISILIGCLVGTCIYHFNKYTTASTAYILNLHNQVDSLTMEIELRDILLSKCKDTSYGEEFEPTRQDKPRSLPRNARSSTRNYEYYR